MKPKGNMVSDEMRAEYNFDYTKGVRGKYYKHIQKTWRQRNVAARCSISVVFRTQK